MHNVCFVFYAALFYLLGLVNDKYIGSRCIVGHEYPKCLVFYLYTWLAFFVVVCIFYHNNFGMDKDMKTEKDDTELALEKRLLAVASEEDRRMMDKNNDGILDKL